MNLIREFVSLIKGMPDWHEKYNEDMGYLYSEVNNAKSDGIINTYTHSKSGTNHTLTGTGAIMRFTAKAPWIAGDTITVNGTRLNPLNLEGKPLPAGAFVAGMQVVAIQDGQNLQFLTQSYADQFANINSQMENKANKQPSAWIEIPLVEGLESISSSIVCSNLDSGLSIVRFLIYPKDESTKAHLSAHQSIAVLPVGFRPPRFDWCFLTTVDFTPAIFPIYIKGNTGIVLTHSDVDFLDIRGTFVFRSV